MNKRLLAGIAAAGIIGGGTYGFAASLDVTSADVAAGDTTVARCDSNGVDVDYTVVWAAGGYIVDDVTVSGIAASCDTQAIKVTLLEGAAANEQSGVVDEDPTPGSESFEFSAQTVAAEDLSAVHVLIAG